MVYIQKYIIYKILKIKVSMIGSVPTTYLCFLDICFVGELCSSIPYIE
jgi:hypothetical protein